MATPHLELTGMICLIMVAYVFCQRLYASIPKFFLNLIADTMAPYRRKKKTYKFPTTITMHGISGDENAPTLY